MTDLQFAGLTMCSVACVSQQDQVAGCPLTIQELYKLINATKQYQFMPAPPYLTYMYNCNLFTIPLDSLSKQ